MGFRRVLFWIHLGVGSVAGIVILIMSFTGVLLAFERQITAWVDRGHRSNAPYAGAPRLAVGALIAGASTGENSAPSSVVVHADPELPVEIGFGRDRTIYFDSFTGRALGAGSQRARHFFQAIEAWHRWLGMPGGSRSLGRLVTGICNLVFLGLIVTGLFLWWPRGGTWQRFKAAITPRANLPPGRARNWNWHTVTGFWCAAPLLVMVSCGVVMSFPWANNLLYRLTGNTPPIQGQGSLPSGNLVLTGRSRRTEANAGDPGRDPSTISSKPGRHGEGHAPSRPASAAAEGSGNVDRLNRLWEAAENQVPGWQTITLRGDPNSIAWQIFSIDRGDGGPPDQRFMLTLDGQTGAIVKWEPFSSYNLGRRLRAWVRFSHTGEAAGLFGQAVAALAAAATTLLVFTGLAMAWKRLLGFAKGRA